MPKPNTLFLGADVHKETIDVAYVSDCLEDTVSSYGTVSTTQHAVDKLINKFKPRANKLCFVYEAGPCGYWLHRHLEKRGIDCWVVAPALIPRAPGDKVKTDKRDAITLARLARTGDIQSIYIPDSKDEAIRDLIRCREDAMLDLRHARQRLKSFLLRHGISYSGRQRWNQAHLRGLSDITMPEPPQQIVLQDYIHTITERHERLQRLEQQLEVVAQSWRWFPLVQRLTVMRGIRFLSAMTLIAELGDLRRFPTARGLMNFVGLTPSEHSSGKREKRGGITKCGNTHARRILIEAAWAYRFSPKVSRPIQERQQGHSVLLQKRSWEAQLRLCGRFRQLKARGKEYNKVVAAVARELTGFIWSIARNFEPEATAEG